jgi:L,D-transpeptidase ErfK/SrfK
MSGLSVVRPDRIRLAAAAVMIFLGIGAVDAVHAETYRLQNPSDSVVGFPFYFTTRGGDTLLDVARHNNQGWDDMRQANPKVDMWLPGEGTEVMVPTFYVLPSAPRTGLVMNRAEKRLYYYPPDSPDEIRTYAISIGREGWDTPIGTFSIVEKIKNPTWTPPASVRADYLSRGKELPAVVPPGDDNPLGDHAMRLSERSYLIHGTNKPWGLGMRSSAGCIRMYPEGVEELFGLVNVDTRVTIVDEPYKFGWLGDDLYLEVHLDEGVTPKAARSVVPESLANADELMIDWSAVEKAIRENTGVPQVVGRRVGPSDGSYLPMIF